MSAPKISYLNEQEIELYYKLYDIKKHIKTTSKLTIEASLLGGPKVSQQFEKKNEDYDIVDKLFAIWDYLKTNDLINYSRPNTIEEFECEKTDFVFERVIAHKLLFPKSKLSELSGLDHLVVWISDPDFNIITDEQYPIIGTFLYLIESLYDKGRFRTTISGCSALQALSNIINGRSFYTQDINEQMTRKHPYEKLQDIGAIYLHKQEIQTIYRKRYMTNEQCFTYNNRDYRCNDLLGYPLFVS